MSATDLQSIAEEHRPTGITRWLYTTNHKDIGILYMVFGLIMFLVGGLLSLLIRLELFQPGMKLMHPELFNQVIGVHGLVMVFAALMPFTAGMANYLIPMMIGAPDMALPRLNNFGFWLLTPAAILLVLPWLLVPFGIGYGTIDTGWTIYAPLSIQSGLGMDFAIFTVFFLALSSTTFSINVIATVLNMRAPGMTFYKIPIFVWSWLWTALLLIAVFPALVAGAVLLFADRHFGTHFFAASGGGDSLLWVHLFWFFGHPEVYILLFPTVGILPHILSAFARKPIYGYKAQVYSFAAVGFLSVIVWAHHMYTSGLPAAANIYFMYATMSISIPVSILFFCWFGTIWRGAMTFETPMLFAIGFIVLFGIGGLTGLVLSDAAADQQYHGSYFVVAHFHYTLFGGPIMGVIAAAYYYLPKMTGRMYNEKLGKWHFWLTMIGVNATFFPQFLLGIDGMPRRIPDYALQFTDLNLASSIGALVLGASQLLFVYNIIRTAAGAGERATGRVWEGARGLEFTVSSPPPYHTFLSPPVVE